MAGMIILHTAVAGYPHVRAIHDGSVASARVRLDFADVPVITRAFRRMVRTLDFDLCEIALTTLAQAHAFGKPIKALPIVVMRGLPSRRVGLSARITDRGSGQPVWQTHRCAGVVANHGRLGARHPAGRVRR